jgi:glycopeptide antibiotics resistance protein
MRLLAAIVTLAWLAAGLVLTLRPIPEVEAIAPDNAIPFVTFARCFAAPAANLSQVVGNLGLLGVIGFPAPIAWRWLDRWWRVAITAAAISIAIELIQLPIPGRAADIDDVILNVVGAVLAYGVWRLLSPPVRLHPEERGTR